MPELDVKAGPGRNLTKEKADIKSREAPRIVHSAHLRKSDFENHGFTERCPGCSAILRGLNTQPRSEQCRGRMEKLPEKDRESDGHETAGREAKRLRLEEMENQATNEENADKLTKLFEDYRSENIRGHLGHPVGDGDTKRSRVQPGDVQGSSGHDVASSSSVPSWAVEADEMDVNEVNFDIWKYFEFAIDATTGRGRTGGVEPVKKCQDV